MKPKSIFIGIVGPSGAGKTTICKTLKKSSRQFEHIRLDNYFKSPKTFPKKFGFLNWELPSNLKFNKLVSDLKKLNLGQTVETKTFPKKKGLKPEAISLKPKKYILIEGFMLFKDKRVRDMLDLKIYLDVPKNLMLKRREVRFGKDHVNDYDTKVAIPEFMKYGVSQKKYADVRIDTTSSQSVVVKKVLAAINTKV